MPQAVPLSIVRSTVASMPNLAEEEAGETGGGVMEENPNSNSSTKQAQVGFYLVSVVIVITDCYCCSSSSSSRKVSGLTPTEVFCPSHSQKPH
jgi:hypothetical protein